MSSVPPCISVFANLAGCDIGKCQLCLVQYPRTEYLGHMAFKGAQVGGLLGCLAGAAYGWKSCCSILPCKRMYGMRGLQIGAAAGALWAALFSIQAEDATCIARKCVYFRTNKPFLTGDRVSLVGLAAGAIGAKYCVLPPGSALFGFSYGFLLGNILGHCCPCSPCGTPPPAGK